MTEDGVRRGRMKDRSDEKTQQAVSRVLFNVCSDEFHCSTVFVEGKGDKPRRTMGFCMDIEDCLTMPLTFL